jgi:4'-phosphopantetheinyl transferase EntD
MGIGRVLPRGVAYADSATVSSVDEMVDESRSLGPVSERRQAEFSMGRRCAHAALARLGERDTNVGTKASGEPAWPMGLVGSITHTTGYVAAAAARASEVRAIGIDAERVRTLEADIGSLILTREERLWVAGDAERLISVFSAKESVFKAWYPIRAAWLDFKDVAVSFTAEGRFFPRLVNAPRFETADQDAALIGQMVGNWRVDDRLVLTAAYILS